MGGGAGGLQACWARRPQQRVEKLTPVGEGGTHGSLLRKSHVQEAGLGNLTGKIKVKFGTAVGLR